MKLRLYLKLQEYFGYENDRTHAIKVVVLVVKINIQLTYGIHGFTSKTSHIKQIKSNQINFISIMGPRGANRNYTYSKITHINSQEGKS
jgi:hypothetical protein